MSRKLLNLCLMMLFSVVSTAAWALSEVGGVYQIGTADDLIAFAELVNGGNAYANAVLTADIDKGTDLTMIGKDGVDYQGTFDGQGHTITINATNTYEETKDEYQGTAIFRNVGANALIQNLKVQGTIVTNQKLAAGIAVWNRGTIRGCYIDVSVDSSVGVDGDGDATHGGVCGVAYQGAMIENTLSKFTISGAKTVNCGGIVGWCDGRTNIINCLVINDDSSFNINGESGTLGRNPGNIVNVNLSNYIGHEYDNRPGGASTNNYATKAWGNKKCVEVVSYADLADGRICYQLNNDQSHIAWAQTMGTDPFPVPAVFGGQQVYASASTDCSGKMDGAVLTFSNSGTVQAMAHQYDKFGICHVCGCYNIYGLERDITDGSLLVKTAGDIDLCEGLNRLQNGGWFTIKMANDIEYTAEPGRYIFNTGNWFDGNFNGNGHELTIVMDVTESNASLFPNFSGTFENVIMHGSITTTGQYASSITSHTRRGNVKIRNVFSDIDINTSCGGDNTSAGLIGVVEEKTIVDNTIYAGNVNGNGESTECLAGFAGWSAAQAYFTNCAFLGTLNGAIGDSKTLSRNPNNITCENVYIANSFGYEDEAKATLIENSDDIENGALAYALNSNQSGLDRFYQKIGEDLFPMPIKKEGALVYAVASGYRCDGQPLGSGVTYANSPSSSEIPPHTFEEGWCTVCGGLQEDFLTPVDGWFEISNGLELLWWSHYAAKHLDANAKLTNDIDMADYSDRWAQVGTEGKPFYGNFDGQFHTISNLVIDMPNANGVGLISVMNSLPEKGYGGLGDDAARNAEGVFIKNVVLDESCSILGRGYVALVGMTAPWAGHVNIKGVMMCGDVTANGGPNAAGVFGCVMGSACHVTIDNCGMVGDVYGPKENGSFSGWLGDWAEVTNCFAVGKVDGIESDARYFARYGNSRVNDNIKNCYALYGTQEHVGIVKYEDFESGALAWKANGEQFRTAYWYQNIGEDLYPYPYPTHGFVIYAAEQYFSVVEDDDVPDVATIIRTYELNKLDEIIATQSVLDDYVVVVDELDEVSTILGLADALDAVNEAKEGVEANAAIYQAYIAKCEEVKGVLESDHSFSGDIRTALEYYLTENDDPNEDNTLGTYAYIIEQHTATADEIEAETARVEEWLKHAIGEDYVAGTDISWLIPNGDFSKRTEEGKLNNWEEAWCTGYGQVKDENKRDVVGVEAWNVTGDMFQTVEDMKPGYYLVGVNGAFRPSNNRYSLNYAAGIYANGIFNYFPTVVEDYIAVNDTIDQVNCNLHGNGAHDLAIYDDFETTEGEEGILGYAVHGETGMAAAANAGRYPVYTLAYVGEDGKLTIGIKNPGTKYGNDWTGWGALKVKYCGEEGSDVEDALKLVLKNMKLRANTLLTYEFDDTNAPAAPNYPAELKEALDEAANMVELDEDGNLVSVPESLEDQESLIKDFSELFESIYEGKQAYVSLFNTYEGLGFIDMGNLPLIEYSEEDSEWYETGEQLFTEDDMEVLWNVHDDLQGAYAEGSYSTEEALNPSLMEAEDIKALVPAKDEEGYYLISNPKQLAAFRAISNNMSNTLKAKVTEDINMEGIGWLPINTSDYRFGGEFDGQGHALTNVVIPDRAEERTGLFNTIEKATVKNLKLTGEYYSSKKFIGGITGYAYNSTIENCDVAVTINSLVPYADNGSTQDGTHGGLIGVNESEGTVVNNCLVNCPIFGESTNSCGGVCGWATNKMTVKNTLIISQGSTIDTNGCNTISRNEGNCSVSNVYFLEPIGSENGEQVTVEELASGEVTYKLNGEQSDDPVWFQTLGTDATPHLFKGLTVYFVNGEYTNEPPTTKGDANGDTEVNLADYQTILGLMARDADVSENPAADVNRDGFINLADAQTILGIMAGQ